MISLPPISLVDPSLIGQVLVESDAFAVCALDGSTLRFASPALRTLLGMPPDMVVDGLSFESFALPSERAGLAALLDARDAPTVSTAFTGLRPDHSTVDLRLQGARARFGRRNLLVAVVTDATEERRERESLSALAFVDPLTGLPNRALFLDRVRDAIVSGARDGRTFALFLGDLDGFKQVNDTLGHDAGDAVLRLAASRLRSATRAADTVARLGGDELAAVLPSAGNAEAAGIVAGRILRAIGEPMTIGGHTVTVGMSLGVALFPRDAADMDTLIAAADRAMYVSKRAGKNRVTFAQPAGEIAPERHVFVAWNDRHELGITFMDDDHRALATLANTVGEHLKAGHDHDQLAGAFSALRDATTAHFEREEQQMHEHRYPGHAAHAQEHGRLLEDLQNLALHIDESSMMLSMRFLADWLFRHVDTVDRGLARWLRERHDASSVTP
jgi:diguanylate cyclase (GGDEF)-like protein/hemerythrin-like metal-binding protein